MLLSLHTARQLSPLASQTEVISPGISVIVEFEPAEMVGDGVMEGDRNGVTTGLEPEPGPTAVLLPKLTLALLVVMVD